MEKYISREDTPEVVAYLYQILVDVSEINTLDVYHVIFSMGTIITINPEENITPFVYTPEHMETWPVERLDPDEYSSADAPSIYKDLCSVYSQQLEKLGEYRNIIAAAYTKLINSIQINCEETVKTADIIIPIEENLHMVRFADFANIIDSPPLECISTVIEMYKFDHMFPQIYAVITPELDILLWSDDK